MEENKKKYMTIFFKKSSLEIDSICTGRQEKLTISPLTEDEMDIIYGRIIMEYDEYIFNYKSLFHIVKTNNNEYNIEMKEESKTNLEKFIK